MEDGQGEAFLSREEWALQRTGEENEPAVADADRAEHREVVFGQTCPIETAVDVPVDGSRITANGIILVVTNGNGCVAPTARIEWSEPTTVCGRLPGMEHCSPSLSW